MDTEKYKRRLLDLEKHLANRVSRERQGAVEQVLDSAADIGDISAADEAESEAFSEAELDATVLQQVRDALKRIEDGTYGRCIVDGQPIEEKRLEAVPWTPYCLKHQRLAESSSRPVTPTL